MRYLLAIVDPAYSSWSLRAWLLFARFGLQPELATGHLGAPDAAALFASFAPARTAPALRIEAADAPILVWDSLAIAETLAERHPALGLWPAAPADRGFARALAAEMHASFQALRGACPMNLRRAYAGFAAPEAVRADLARIEALWSAARSRRPHGPWLCGDYSVADAFFAPVAARIASYDLPVGAAARGYVARHLADPAFLRWRAMALADPVVQARYELDLPTRPWPGPG